MLNILITGANRGLGFFLANKFSRTNLTGRLFLTAKNINALKIFTEEKVTPLCLDLAINPDVFYQSDFYQRLPAKLDIVIHCAAPYDTVKLMEATKNDLIKSAFVNGTELLVLTDLMHRLKPNGTLIAAGSISGELYCHTHSFWNATQSCILKHNVYYDKYCVLHALHKGILKNLMYCLQVENPGRRVIYANISAFMDEVPDKKKDSYLTTDKIATELYNLAMSTDENNLSSIDILSKEVAEKLKEYRKETLLLR